MTVILCAERDTGYNGKLGTCVHCGQPRQRLNAAGWCKACEQAAERNAGKRINRRLPKRGKK